MADLLKAGINLTLQGEAQYIAGLRNVNREMDLMATNTKLAVAQLGHGASPTQKFQAQMKNLGAEIEKASTKTLVLRNRNKELPDQIHKTGKSLDELKDKYKEQTTRLEELRSATSELTHHQKYHTESGKELNKAYNEQNDLVKQTKAEVDQLEGAYNNMLDEYERMPNSMAEAQLAAQKLLNEQKKLREEYIQSGGVLASFSDNLEKRGESLQKFGRNVSDIGNAFMGVTAGIIAGGGGALKAFMDWETGMRGVMKTNDEVFDSNGNVIYSYEELEAGLRELARTIPVTHGELAELAEIAGRLQVPTEDVIMFTEVVAKLGETTNLTSEEAAEQLGKFINITGAGTDTVLNLANALVELGNNTASSEQEALRMSTRWASTGDIIGMTDDQILALSASVISLGIRTEAGGSAVQRAFLKINDAVLEGGDTLAMFADQASMSSSEFKRAWQDDAAHALIPFLKGLNDTHEAGGNVNAVLKDLGISSVNELNTLLVLAGGYDQLAGNLELASKAYNETEQSMMALNKEAELAYGSTLGKLRTAWNRLKDSLIDIGEPIADAVIDMVDALEPVFQTIEKMATSFSELDETAQRDIISMIAKVALIGPALKLAGGAISTLGDIFVLTGGLSRKFGSTLTKAMLESTTGTLELGAAAQVVTGSKGVGGLVSVLSGAGAGALPWALGIAGAALAGWGLWKVWGEDAWEAAESTRQWGASVDEETQSILADFQEVGGKFGNMVAGFSTDKNQMVDDLTTIGQTIEEGINSRLEATQTYLGNLPDVLRESQEKVLQDQVNAHKESQEQVINNNKEIQRIQEQANKENREVNATELAYIRKINEGSLGEYLSLLNLTAEEERSIRQAVAGDVENIQTQQVNTMIRALMREENELTKHRNAQLAADREMATENGVLNEKLYNELAKNTEEYYGSLSKTRELTLQDLLDLNEDYIEQYDLYTGELLALDQDNYDARVQANRDLVASWDNAHHLMRERSKEFGDVQEWLVDISKVGAKTWNDMIVESGGNMDVFRQKVRETSKTAEGWNHIRFQVHDANLDSNARLIIGEAAIANGWWDGMAWEDKQAILKDNFSETVYKAIVDEGTWEKLGWEERIAVLNNDFSDTITQALIDDGTWQKINWEERKAILTTNSPDTLRQILSDLNVWKTMPIAVRRLLADKTPIDQAVNAAQRKLNSLRDKQVTLTTRNLTIYESIYRAGNSASSQRFVQSGGRLLYNRGTDNHPGGLAVVNDQKGATFRELVTLPDGSSFVPSGRDVLLDLPKGSKVLRAALTKMKFPNIKQYKDGVGYSRKETQKIMNSNTTDMNQTNQLLNTLISLVSSGQVIQMDGNEVGRTIYPGIDNSMARNIQRSQIMNM